MPLSDCPKCWMTPCECGHEYEKWSKSRLQSHIEMLQRVLQEKLDDGEGDPEEVTP